MSAANDGSRSQSLTRKLSEEIVITESVDAGSSGAAAIASDDAPRAPHRVHKAPARGMTDARAGLHDRIERFLSYQSELLDTQCWREYIDLFADDGVYWMPATPEQTEWLDFPSIFIEDKALMQVRRRRIEHPNAWSQAAAWGTSHVLGNVIIESRTDEAITVRSRFQMIELRRDSLRHFAGTYRHTLIEKDADFKIALQRVDLLNAQASFDYVLQAWV